MTDFDVAKSEISISSIFLPPKTISETIELQSFEINSSKEGNIWKEFILPISPDKAKEMLFM
jgi:hypothetical protein